MFRNPTTDLIIVLAIVLLIFGPKRLPGLGRQLGQGLREFKDSITGDSGDADDGERPEIARTSAASELGPAPAAPTRAAQERTAAEVSSPGTAPKPESAEIGSERRS